MRKKQRVWQAAREYAGFAEAGGVKVVVRSIARVCSQIGLDVTVFLPRYGSITQPLHAKLFTKNIELNGQIHTVCYYRLHKAGVRFIFIDAEIFTSKKDIYTYTADEAVLLQTQGIPVKKGEGHIDASEMNMLFQRAIHEYAVWKKTVPDVLHCHDAHTALLPILFLTDVRTAEKAKSTRMVVTIHNAGDGYRQSCKTYDEARTLTGFSESVLQFGMVHTFFEPFIAVAPFAQLTTVSPWYAEELQDPNVSPFSYHFSHALKEKHIGILGITNGIDVSDYNPEKKEVSLLPFKFSLKQTQLAGKYACRDFLIDAIQQTVQPYKDIEQFGSLHIDESQRYVYLAYHGRLVPQKGVDVLLKSIPRLLSRQPRLRFLIMGQGVHDLEESSAALAQTYIGSCVYFKGYNRALARLVTASADFIVLPSLFEPCGLEDFISQIFATIPIAHAVGGLHKIIHNKTGFLYYTPKDSSDEVHRDSLVDAVLVQTERFFDGHAARVLEVPFFYKIANYANKVVQKQFSWEHIVLHNYKPLYFGRPTM